MPGLERSPILQRRQHTLGTANPLDRTSALDFTVCERPGLGFALNLDGYKGGSLVQIAARQGCAGWQTKKEEARSITVLIAEIKTG